MAGGSWHPSHCTAKYFVAIIIPYRDRKTHLLQLLYYLHPMLKRQQLNYRVFVVEQVRYVALCAIIHILQETSRPRFTFPFLFSVQIGNNTFNKGAIMNAAFHSILKYKLLLAPLGYICFIFHDVDMLPENDGNLYSCSEYPRHLSVAVNEFGYK